MKKRLLLIVGLCMILALAPMGHAEDFSGTTIRLAQQFGMQYAPAYVMQRMGILEKHLPGATIEWSNLGGGSAINEALISNQIDVGFMGVPPMVIAWNRGVDYRIACGISVQPGQLMIKGDAIQSLKDITEADKIALPSIGSIQHIWLAMAAEQELGDPHALDKNIIPMANPDAYAALISGTDVAGHYASMPYLALEQADGMRGLVKSSDVFPEGTGIVCVASKGLYENTAVYQALMAALAESIELVNSQSEEVIKIIAEVEKLSEEDVKTYLNWENVGYTTDPAGVMGLADFMYRTNYINTPLSALEDITWPATAAQE